MSRVATVRFSVLRKCIVGQMGYCSTLCNDLVDVYVLFFPQLRSKLFILFLTDSASCNCTRVAFLQGYLNSFVLYF